MNAIHNAIYRMYNKDNVSYFLFELQEKAAIRIQSAWRGHRARKALFESQQVVRCDRAARVIQRAVRHWSDVRKQRGQVPAAHFDRIDEDTLRTLQQQIAAWDAKYGRVKFESTEELEKQHNQVQTLLHKFYCDASVRRLEDRNLETTCTNVEATTHLLHYSPDLKHQRDVDLSVYRCRPLPDAAAARLCHKQQLHALTSPWWKKL